MIFARPGSTFTTTVDGFPTGLVGTLAARLEHGDGTNLVPRSTAGIVEVEPGSGVYSRTFVAPTAEGAYLVLWDDGAGGFAYEDLRVSYSTPDPPDPGGGEADAYAQLGDVQALNTGRHTFTASSKPRSDQVVGFLESTSLVLDGILRERNYVLPIATSAVAARRTLSHYNALGAAALVEKAAPSRDDRDFDSMWRGAQKMLRSGDIELDAARDTNETRPRHSFPATHSFSRGMRF